MKINLNKIIILSVFVFSLLFYPSVSFAASNLISLQANVVDNTGIPLNGNITIEIWNNETGGSLIYNSTDDFKNNITDGKLDIMLGSVTDLNLSYGTLYYLEAYVNNEELNFSGKDRQQFQSSVGNVSSEYIEFNTSIIPETNKTFDFGSLSNLWKNIFALGGEFTEELIIGNNNFSNINIGIGTLNPGTLLESVGGDVNITNGSDIGVYFNSNKGYFGIGVEPSFKLDITRTSIVTTAFVPTVAIRDVVSETSGTIISLLPAMSVNPNSDSSASYRVMKADVTTPSGNAANYSNSNALLGIILEAQHQGTGDITGGMKGGYFSASNQNTGTVDEAMGSYFEGFNTGAGIITDAYGGQFVVGKTAGTITTGYAGYFDASGATTNWGIYVANGNAYLGSGNVGIGATSPTHKLNVVGTTNISVTNAPALILDENTTAVACNATNAGGIIYSSGKHYGCDGSTWSALY